MTDSNRLQLSAVKETTVGTTPTTPRMRLMRLTGEGLKYSPTFVNSAEIRSDRMNVDPILVGQTNDGPIQIEWHYPVVDSPLASALESAFLSTWSNTPSRDNDGTADSVITQMTAATGVMTVTSSAAFVAGHLVYNTNFTNSGNNGLFKITTGSATVPAVGAALLTDEAVPPATARIKVVGLQGAAGDVTATATGLGSTLLDFTTLGIVVGQWLKVGGTATAFKFATAALNDWMRVTAITATAITLDNRPSGWTTDSGAAKTIRVFFGDRMINGTTLSALSIERGFLGQVTPTYILQTGMAANTLEMRFSAQAIITGSFGFMGLSGAQSTSSVDASPDAAPSNASYQIMAAGANVGRVAEAGSAAASPSWVHSLTVNVNNNLRMLTSVDSSASVGHGKGSADVSATLEAYFGDNALLAKLLAGTATNVNIRAAKSSQALVVTLPRLTYTAGSPNASAKNTDVMLSLTAQASYDSTTGAHICVDRLEYYE